MCCIFTCCGWMIDLIQRLWTFTMSCCISSAVCCSLVTASMSGIALGYNYSLAEYVDLKETNVSIYLKRGVFDDEIADDIDWRRSGRMPVAGHIGDQNLITGGSEDETTTLRSGRRLDDSIFQSNDKNNFEGALMKLTAKPPGDTSKSEIVTPELAVADIMSRYPSQPLDQMKAVQSIINMRKAAEAQRRLQERPKPPQTTEESGRRMLPRISVEVPPFDEPSSINSLRLAVPDQAIHHPSNWKALFRKPDGLTRDDFDAYNEIPTIPSPITPRPGPVRPSRPSRPRPMPTQFRPSLTTATPPMFQNAMTNIRKDIKEEMDAFNEKLLLDKYDEPSLRDDSREKLKKGEKQSEEDYEEDIKGIPIRKKRDYNLNEIESNNSKKLFTITNIQDLMSKLRSLSNTYPDTTIYKTHEENKNMLHFRELTDATFLQLIISTTMS
ncbi:uncharacterized protein LOC123696236 [Colias croceus]|uniref:uncharacterized protein LOC123696236 n=1 Tax=Colias crocea TaxID=72248 RepID=UPI001E27D524|nr:uncharacterized protein LOC123696236 [Colias croceus]